MKEEILSKYSIPVPRYTSYPPANFFNETFTAGMYKDAIIRSNRQDPNHISVYIHIPFCYRMCYYCGCNATQLKDRKTVDEYIDAVKKEMRMVFALLDRDRKISQIHYGGGTPTLLPVGVLSELNTLIRSEFNCIEHPEIAIECHPGYMTEAYWMALSGLGFNRVSIGIQDFNEEVLRMVHRKTSRLPIETVVSILREQQIATNLDLIYGLPGQTTSSFRSTIQKAISLKPDRVVTFSYAHVPWVNPLQKKLEEAGLPGIQQKNELFAIAGTHLKDAGYQPIGLDHFVLPGDELYLAAREKRLHRNFQGYCSRRTTGQVYAFGVTGISQLADSYSQNTKDISTYIAQINKGELSVLKGYALNSDEQIAREVIATLMCNYQIHWNEVAERLKINITDVKKAINYNEEALTMFAADGIIELTPDSIRICDNAAPFVRNVAASLDRLMTHSQHKYSKPI